MTDPNYTAVKLIVDRSGSMTLIREATQDALNEFIHGQASLPGRVTVSLSQFDDTYETVFRSTPAADCPVYELVPRGATALLDAVGRAVKKFGKELEEMPEDERPGHVVVGIMTDGHENSSRTYNYEQIARMLTHQQEKYNWQFLFMGANQDAIATGAKMGLRANSSITYSASSLGTQSVVGTMSGVVATASAGGVYHVTEQDREEAAQ